MNENGKSGNEKTFLLLRYLVRTGRITEARLDTLLSKVDLSATRLLTLRQLEQADEPLSLSQLATCLAFVKSNATQLVDNLEAQQLVNRVPDPRDRRCTLLEMTEEGRQRHEAAQQVLQPLLDKLETIYTVEERSQLLGLLQRLDAALL